MKGIDALVHPGDLPATGLVQVPKESTDDGRSEVTGVERFGNVRGGELDDDLLALSSFEVASVRVSVKGFVILLGRRKGADLSEDGRGEGSSAERIQINKGMNLPRLASVGRG
jgi:hypothetical protein